MYGPGGLVREWKLAAALAALEHKTIVVPAKTCASACVIAVGLALHLGADVRINPDARFIVHNIAAFMQTPMPDWFRARMLAGEVRD